MTYCLAIRGTTGTVFAADTRTNAGVDYVTSYRKLHVFRPAPDRIFILASAGNLATTQEIMSWLQRDLDAGDERETFLTCDYPFEAAQYVGRVSRAVQEEHRAAMQASGVQGDTTLILGGQLQGQPQKLFLVYPQGNFIEASEDTPYLQVGESKYGKPTLDSLGTPNMSLGDAARLCIISLDATIRSNLTVGLPIDLAVLPTDHFELSVDMRIHADSQFYQSTRQSWQDGMMHAFANLPAFDWEAR